MDRILENATNAEEVPNRLKIGIIEFAFEIEVWRNRILQVVDTKVDLSKSEKVTPIGIRNTKHPFLSLKDRNSDWIPDLSSFDPRQSRRSF
jgi:hypothetical protein